MISSRRKRQLRYITILPALLLVIGYQLRSSIETIRLARDLNFWLPFSVEPFSDRIQSMSGSLTSDDPVAEATYARGGGTFHLIAVNHHQFRGMSVYLTQLWNHHPTIGPDPKLQILMRNGDSRPFAAYFLIPHCTCVTGTVWQLTQLFLLCPLFCVLLAFFILLREPGSINIWGIAALLLALSQLDLVLQRASFQSTANTMAWTDWSRVPATAYRAFAQSIWPAALVLTAPSFFAGTPAFRKWSRRIAALLVSYCLLRTLLAVAWSEDYLPFVPLYEWVQVHRSEEIAAIFLSIAALTFLQNRALGAVVSVLAVMALSVLFGALPITVPNSPAPIISPRAVVPGFVAATFLALLAFNFRRLERSLAISFLLLLPPVLYLLGNLNGNIDPGMSQFYLVFVLLCAGSGLLGVCMQTLRPRSE